MPSPTLPPETPKGLGLPGYNQSVAKALLDHNSSATGTSGVLKRKAYALDEPEAQPYPHRARSSVDDEADYSNIKKEPGTERTTDSPPTANDTTEHIGSSKSVSRLTSAEGGDVDRSYNHISGFTPVNGRVSREHGSTRAGRLENVNSSNQGVTQVASKPNIESLTDNDVGMSPLFVFSYLRPQKIHLLAAIAEVEAKFEREKWDLVAEAMKRAGAAEYSRALLRKSAETLNRIHVSILADTAHSHTNNIETTPDNPKPSSSVGSIDTRHKPSKTDGTDHGSNRGNYQGFGVLVNQKPLQNTAQVPANIRHQMSRQSGFLPGPAPPLGTAPCQQAFHEPSPLYPAMSPSHPPSSQRNNERPLPHHSLVQETFLQQDTSKGKSSGENSAIFNESRLKTPSSGTVVTAQDSNPAEKSKKPISKSQLKDMLRHRTLNDTNRSKPLDVIAKECGMDAPLNEISKSLEQAGFPTVLYTDTGAPIFVVNPASSAITSSHTAYVSLNDSKHASSDPLSSRTPTSTDTAIDLTKETDKTISPSPPRGSQILLAGATERTPPNQTGPERRKKGHRNESAESRERRSAAMRKAWAKRQAEGRSGRGCGPPKSSTIARNAQSGSSPVAFAAQVLAAAAADAAAEAKSPSKTRSRETSAVSPTPIQVKSEEGPSSTVHRQDQDSDGQKVRPDIRWIFYSHTISAVLANSEVRVLSRRREQKT